MRRPFEVASSSRNSELIVCENSARSASMDSYVPFRRPNISSASCADSRGTKASRANIQKTTVAIRNRDFIGVLTPIFWPVEALCCGLTGCIKQSACRGTYTPGLTRRFVQAGLDLLIIMYTQWPRIRSGLHRFVHD